MKRPVVASFALGLALGLATIFFVMQGKSVPHTLADSFATDPETDADSPIAMDIAQVNNGLDSDHEWNDLLSHLSGSWTSIDGQINAKLDFRMLRFKAAPDWPDLENQTFLLGREMQFLSSRGVYMINAGYSKPDEMWFCLEDEVTADLTSFTLFREGTPKAGSRTPIPRCEPPPKVKEILSLIPSIRARESKDDVMKRMRIAELDGYEILDGESGLGQTDLIVALGIDDHWMLSLSYKRMSPDDDDSEAVIENFKLFQGYVDDVRGGFLELERVAFPYYEDGKIITGPSKAEQAPPKRP